MGHPISPDDPPWEGCLDGLDRIPEEIAASLQIPDFPLLTGTLTHDDENPQLWEGTVTSGEISVPFHALFCAAEGGALSLFATGDADIICGRCVLDGHHCYPSACATSPGGCEFRTGACVE